MNPPIKKKEIARLLIFLSIVILSGFFANYFQKKSTPTRENILSEAQKGILEKEKKIRSALYAIRSDFKGKNHVNLFSLKISEELMHWSSQGVFFLVYEHDSLVFWNDNSAAIEEYMKQVCLDNPLAVLSNGYFQVIQDEQNTRSSTKIFGLLRIKNDYPYQNKYLENNFAEWLHFPEGTVLQDSPEKSQHRFLNSSGKFIFGIGELTPINQFNFFRILAILFGLLFLFLPVFILDQLFRLFLSVRYSSLHSFLLISFLFVCVRFFMLLAHYPSVFYDSPLVDFTVFGDSSSFFNSTLPDIILNCLLLVFASIRFYIINTDVFRKSRISKEVLILFLFITAAFFTTYISNLFYGFVENSSISFDVTYLFKLSSISLFIFFLFGLLFFSCYLVFEKTVFIIKEEITKKQSKVRVLFFVMLIVILIPYCLCNEIMSILWPPVTFFLLFFLRKSKGPYPLSLGIVFVLWFSAITAYYFLKFETKKETDSLKIYAERLVESKDEVAENLFADVSKKIKTDSDLNRMLFSNPVPSLAIEQRLRQYYFRGYWEKFKISVSAFDSICTPLFLHENTLLENNSFFDEQIEESGAEPVVKDLFFINRKENFRPYYIGRIQVSNSRFPLRKPIVFYFLFESNLGSVGNGFPELLLDKSINTNKALSAYSFAHFKNGKLQQSFGEFSLEEMQSVARSNSEGFITLKSGQQYFPIRVDAYNTVIIAKSANTFSVAFTGYSYFFMFYSFLLWFYLFVYELIFARLKGTSSLSNKVQLLVVSVVLLALTGTGIGTFYFIQKQFDAKNKNALDEKMLGVLRELKRDLSDQASLRQNYKEYTEYLLQNYSTVFTTDISLYDLKGNLYAGSQPKLYEEGIVSKKMNPVSFRKMNTENQEKFVLKENVGQLNYFSAYHCLNNKEGKLLAYVNLPYFSKQSDLEKEISTYFVTLVNIFVVLFAISALMGIFISSQITKPLRLLQTRLSKVRLGSVNETIDWRDNDEVGKLVNEYNFMIEELEKSAELLAKSEREGAWREMAKQVAHEIKNPLTPMKLSIQHLVRTSHGDAENLSERVRSVSTMLIEQIDTLTSIASSFSEFAKLPGTQAANINLPEYLENYMLLYKNSSVNSFSLRVETREQLFVSIDKNHLLRVLNNLLKNAMQSLLPNRKGEIEIVLQKRNSRAVLTVIDNGSGISQENLKSIFMPNFSTKSDGMGLGLAMVKSMIESAGGTIHCESEENKGTSFSITLPLLENTNFQP